MSRTTSIIDAALARAAQTMGSGTEKQASAAASSLAEQARESARALEYVATKVADDGSAEGRHRRQILEDFFADKEAMKHGKGPAESEAPTGAQATPPQSGKTSITPSKGGNVESEAPTGTQTTIGQEPVIKKPPTDGPGKYASLYDLVMGKEAAKGGPADTHALEDQAAPPKKNETSNRGIVSGQPMDAVRATKRQAKAPTRARLKQLFSGASDTGPANAAAKAAFPQAYSKGGGIKEAAKDEGAEGSGTKGLRRTAAGALTGAAGAVGGAVAGLGAGAAEGLGYHAYKKHKARKAAEKKGSISDYAQLFDAVLEGHAGEEAQKVAQAIAELGD